MKHLPDEFREAQEWYNIWTLPPLKSQYHLYQAYNFVGGLLTALNDALGEVERLREAGDYLYDESVEEEGGICKCYQYSDKLLAAPDTICALCAWKDALSKDK